MTSEARRDGLASLLPGYFGMVMATGIVSLAAWHAGLARLAWAMLVLNIAVYALLWVLNAARLIRHPRRYGADLIDFKRGPGFFTFVAATTVLGSQLVILAHDDTAGFVLLAVASGLWIVLNYTIFTAFIVKERKPTVERGIDGTWLLAVVATESIAVLAALLAGHVAQPLRIELNFLALSMWLWGGLLYIWLMSLILYRYIFFRFPPEDLSPSYWINMGAMAISTLAGARLIANAADAPHLASLLPFLNGFTVFHWATATWWIPLLLMLGIWRYAWKRYSLVYEPIYWSVVFPLGMYAVATAEMTEALGFAFLEDVPAIFFWIAFAAWLVTLAALAGNLVRLARPG